MIRVYWSNYSDYMRAVWSRLSDACQMEIEVILSRPTSSRIPYREVPSEGVTLLEWDRQVSTESGGLAGVVVGGWSDSAYRKVARRASSTGIPVVLAMDTPFTGSVRQMAGRIVHRRFFASCDAALVASVRASCLASWLGFGDDRIRRGVYGYNTEISARSAVASTESAQVRTFLFVGRKEPVKGVPELLAGYDMYRRHVDKPWPLLMVGTGSLEPLVARAEGVRGYPFVQPDELSAIYCAGAVFVQPSRVEPWGVAQVEALACGLPVIATRNSALVDEILHDGFNAFIANSVQPELICEQLLRAHHTPQVELRRMQENAVGSVSAHTADRAALAWASALRGAGVSAG